jgi:sugar/nucleoside kinase (ribokinase family)
MTGRPNFLGAFGHVVLDHIVYVPRLPEPGLTVPVEGLRIHFGGTAGNVARAASRLGVPTALASFVGEDFPEEYGAALRSDGVDLTDLEKVHGYTTPRAWIFNDPKGDQAVIIDQGPMKDAPKFPVKEHTVRSSRLIHIGTGRPEYYRSVVVLAKELGRTVAFDPSQEIHYVYKPTSFKALASQADFFFANEMEMEKAMKLTGAGEPDDLLQLTPTVVVTHGTRGSTIHTKGGKIRIPCVKASKVVDPTGAGDAYRAGFYAGLHRGYDLGRCGLVGAAVASFAVETLGPQEGLPSWSQVEARLKDYRVG